MSVSRIRAGLMVVAVCWDLILEHDDECARLSWWQTWRRADITRSQQWLFLVIAAVNREANA